MSKTRVFEKDGLQITARMVTLITGVLKQTAYMRCAKWEKDKTGFCTMDWLLKPNDPIKFEDDKRRENLKLIRSGTEYEKELWED